MRAIIQRHPSTLCVLVFTALTSLTITSCVSANSDTPRSITTIYWSDGDSGRIDGTPFRLSDVDAPETGPVGTRHGAKCEAERARGYESKAFMVRLTTGSTLRVSNVHGVDRYDRLVVDIEVNGKDISREAVASGHLEPWRHDGQTSLTAKPDWCNR